MILVCAATRAEHDACGRGIRSSAHDGYEMLLTGVGPVHAARTLAERLAHGPRPDLVVSAGFAGALGTTLALGSWVTAIRVHEWSGTTRVPVEVELVEGPADLHRCDVLSSSGLVSSDVTVDEAYAPLVVDMESASLARESSRRGLPFSVLRLISDTPSHPLPSFLSPFASAMAATTTSSRIAHAARGLRSAFSRPRDVLHLLQDAPTWLRELEVGWRLLASRLASSRP
jgi:nucleoside phosphorylase